MPTLKGRDGSIKTVSQSQADRLLKSGYYQVYTPPAPSGNYYQRELDLSQVDYGRAPINYGQVSYGQAPLDYSRVTYGTGALPGVGETEFYGRDPYTGPRWQEGDARWVHGTLTDTEIAQFTKYMDNMDANASFFWDISFDDQGYVTSAILDDTALMNMEQDARGKEWSDDLINAIQDAMLAGPSGNADLADLFDGPGGGGGGGGGGGRVGPVYVSPDRGVVEDTVRAMLTGLTGDEPDDLVQKYADMYLAAHKNSWGIQQVGGEMEDPNQTVLEAIRGQEDYKRIHASRAPLESETRWISDRMQRLTQLGMESEDADERAVWLAQTGTNLNDIEIGAAQLGKGRPDISLFNKIEKAATLVAEQL